MSTASRQRATQTKLYMLIVFTAIVCAIGGLYLYMEKVAKQRAAENKHSFYQYVVTHHIGQLQDIDDGTGFNPEAYTLVLNHRVPDAKEQEYVTGLMKLYVEYDHGQTMTIVYHDPRTHALRPIADLSFDDDHGVLSETLTLHSGGLKKMQQHVNW